MSQDYVIKPVSLGKQTKDNGTGVLMASAAVGVLTLSSLKLVVLMIGLLLLVILANVFKNPFSVLDRIYCRHW